MDWWMGTKAGLRDCTINLPYSLGCNPSLSPGFLAELWVLPFLQLSLLGIIVKEERETANEEELLQRVVPNHCAAPGITSAHSSSSLQ